MDERREILAIHTRKGSYTIRGESAREDLRSAFPASARDLDRFFDPSYTNATITLFYSVDRWNEWFNAMLFITDPKKVPLQKMLRDIVINNFMIGGMAASFRGLTGSYVTGEAVKMATAVVAVLPILFVYPFLQRHFVKGVMTGALKF